MNLLSQTFRRLSTVCLLAVLLGGFGDQAKAQVVTGVQPVSGSIDVPLNSSIVFTFDVPIEPSTLFQSKVGDFFSGSLHWSANIDPTRMIPTWSDGDTRLTLNYTGDLPGSSTISWEINPASSFLKLAEAEAFFPVANASGSFTTVEGSSCNPDGVPDSFGRLFLSKNLLHVQTSPSAPVLDPASPAVFSAVVQSPVVDPVPAASLKLPDNSSQELISAGGRFFLIEQFDSQAEMDASTAYPAGNYEMTMTRTTLPDTVVNLAVPASYPPVPTVANFPATQTVNPAVDFTLEWGAFSDATGSDIIVLSIEDGNTTVFEAPDLCVPIELPNTATSIVIPAGTLEVAKIYNATLSFYRSFYYSTNDPAGFLTSGALVKSTRFDINTGGSVVVPEPQLSAPTFTPGGLFTFMAGDLKIGTTYQVEYSTTLLPGSWTFLDQITANATSLPIVDDGSSETTGQRFYRIITP